MAKWLTRLGRIAGLDKDQFDEPGEVLAQLLLPTYTTGKILNAARGKDEQSFKSNVAIGAGGEALAGAAVFGGMYAGGAGPFAASGGAGPAAGSAGGAVPGLGAEASAAPYVTGAPQAGPYAAPEVVSQPYIAGAEQPGPYLPGGETAPPEGPSFMKRWGPRIFRGALSGLDEAERSQLMSRMSPGGYSGGARGNAPGFEPPQIATARNVIERVAAGSRGGRVPGLGG